MTSVDLSVVSGGDPSNISTFLRSVYDTTDPSDIDLRVLAVVNTPHDGLRERLLADAEQAGWTDRVRVIENETPQGFATNHNRAIASGTADLHLVANDDVIVRGGAIAELARFMHDPDNARVGVASPQLLNGDGSLQPSTMSFPTVPRMLLSSSGARDARPVRWAIGAVGRAMPRFGSGRSRYWAHDRAMLVDTVRGSFMMVRRRAIEEVGSMDEVSIVGAEETEWHKRMADAGWSVAFVPQAEVIHLGSQTVGLDPRLELEYLRGRLNYFDKHARPAARRSVHAGAAALYSLRWIAALVAGDRARRGLAADAVRLALR